MSRVSGDGSDRVDFVEIGTIVVGAGAVGLAIAHVLASNGHEVAIVEAGKHIGEETSGRSNEVIHAGFLYPAGSLKESLCLRGRDMLYAYCARHGIACRRIGKLVPAVDGDELDTLHRLKHRAEVLGIDDIQLLDAEQAREIEPAITVRGALHSPSSGIVDSSALLLSLLGGAQQRGAMLALRTRAISCSVISGGGFVVNLHSETQGIHRVACKRFVNAAGLGAAALAGTIDAYPAELLPEVKLAQGSLFTYHGSVPFRHLVMPVGTTLADGGAFTLDLAGRGRFGPRLAWLTRQDYRVDEAAAPKVADAVRRYWPDIDGGRLAPAYAGVQPRIAAPGGGSPDWVVQGPIEHGIDGLVNLFGIDTPGLTGCLALAEHVADILDTRPAFHSE